MAGGSWELRILTDSPRDREINYGHNARLKKTDSVPDPKWGVVP